MQLKMRIGYSPKMEWFKLCVVAILLSQGYPTTKGTTSPSSKTQGITATSPKKQGTTATPSTKQGTTATPSTKQGTAATSPTKQGTTATSPTKQGTTAAPSTTQGTTATPSSKQGTTATSPTKQGTTAAPSTTQGTTATPSSKQGTTATPLTKQGTNAAASTKQGTTATSPTKQETAATSPTKQGTTATPSTKQETTAAPPTKKATTATSPTKQGTTATPSTKQGTTAAASTKQGTTATSPIQAIFNVYVIVTMDYTWNEFCKIEKQFREKIAERSRVLKGRHLEATDIFIMNGERNCANANTIKEGIDVWLVALGLDADEVTIEIGNDLKDLIDSRQLWKLGYLFETKIIEVQFGGKNAPRSPSTSNSMNVCMVVAIILAANLVALPLMFLIIRRKKPSWSSSTSNSKKIAFIFLGIVLGLLFLLFFNLFESMCNTRQRQTENDAEQRANHYAMGNIDGSNRAFYEERPPAIIKIEH